jgi:acetyl-CoA C-acetyltransferase
MKAIMLGAQSIMTGDSDVVVAGGMESMSRAPYLLDKARNGYRLGHGQLLDSVLSDGLTDAYGQMHMGTCGDACAERYQFTRAAQDDFAVASYTRARAAAEIAKGEIVPVDAPSGKTTVTVSEDEGPKRFNEEKLRALRPAFGKTGTVTAGNASSLNDGAAALVVASGERLKTLGIKPQARILGYATASREPEWFTIAPVDAMQRLLKQLNLTVEQVDLFEINEAFAVVTMAAMKDLSIPHEKVNVHGGAVAIGHPIGASGARTLVTLIHALAARGGRIGVTSLCIGGGEAVAVAIERVD